MDLFNRRCPTCGNVGFIRKTISGNWKIPWKSFSLVKLKYPITLWFCNNDKCNSHAITQSDAKIIDNAVEGIE